MMEENNEIESYQKEIEAYKKQEEALTKRYETCRKLKQYLKGLDAAIEKRKKSNKASAFQIDSSALGKLYQTVFSEEGK